MSPKKHLIQQWSSMLLMILVGFQIVALFQTHSLIFRLTLCDTILLVIVHGYKWMDNSLPGLQLFLRLAALVTFEALIFVNSTHALEMLFCDESHMHFSKLVVATVILDILIKSLLLITKQVDDLFLKFYQQIILHFLTSTIFLIVTVLNFIFSEENNHYMTMIDPYLTLFIAITLSLIMIPTASHYMPYIFGDTPKDFDIDQFKEDIAKKYENVRCLHIHVFRKWLDRFDIFMHISIRNDMNHEKWMEAMQAELQKIQQEIRSVLKKAGAEKVTIQPHFLQSNLNWSTCINKECELKQLSCCKY
uniref:Uncharacterized protein n=1 Tax=Acrobeloides nanus TaxID=290746 RepID=A0A914DSE2_9BILA